MGRFKFIKARNYKDYWIINELVEQCNEEGKDGRFRWCYAPSEHINLPYVDEGSEAKLVITKDHFPKIVGFYTYTSSSRRIDVLYVVPSKRGRHIALDMVEDFMRGFRRGEELFVLNPGKAVRRMLNKHHPGRFTAVMTGGNGMTRLHFEEEDLTRPTENGLLV
ncbi:MAG: hypothetical protein SA339_08775 [Methanomassiliicoccus sp.]|nr:hypothetical protein [Methanomassiliicoccus sp.]